MLTTTPSAYFCAYFSSQRSALNNVDSRNDPQTFSLRSELHALSSTLVSFFGIPGDRPVTHARTFRSCRPFSRAMQQWRIFLWVSKIMLPVRSIRSWFRGRDNNRSRSLGGEGAGTLNHAHEQVRRRQCTSQRLRLPIGAFPSALFETSGSDEAVRSELVRATEEISTAMDEVVGQSSGLSIPRGRPDAAACPRKEPVHSPPADSLAAVGFRVAPWSLLGP